MRKNKWASRNLFSREDSEVVSRPKCKLGLFRMAGASQDLSGVLCEIHEKLTSTLPTAHSNHEPLSIAAKVTPGSGVQLCCATSILSSGLTEGSVRDDAHVVLSALGE